MTKVLRVSDLKTMLVTQHRRPHGSEVLHARSVSTGNAFKTHVQPCVVLIDFRVRLTTVGGAKFKAKRPSGGILVAMAINPENIGEFALMIFHATGP